MNRTSDDFSAALLAQEVLCGVLTLALLAICSALIWQLLALSRLTRRERTVREFRPRSGLGLPQADLQRLLSQPAPDADGSVECCVCLQEITPSSPSLQLHCCSQLYHHSCIIEWLAVVARCPMCRHAVNPSTSDLEPLAGSL